MESKDVGDRIVNNNNLIGFMSRPDTAGDDRQHSGESGVEAVSEAKDIGGENQDH